jgi:hypothetical protein
MIKAIQNYLDGNTEALVEAVMSHYDIHQDLQQYVEFDINGLAGETVDELLEELNQFATWRGLMSECEVVQALETLALQKDSNVKHDPSCQSFSHQPVWSVRLDEDRVVHVWFDQEMGIEDSGWCFCVSRIGMGGYLNYGNSEALDYASELTSL